VIASTFADGVAGNHFVIGRIDHREQVLALQVDIHLLRDGIVLRHSGLTVEFQGANDFVLRDIHYRFGLASFVGNINLVERLRISAAVGFVLGGQLLDELQFFDVDDADFIFVIVGGVELLEIGRVLDALDSRYVGDRFHQFEALQVDDMQQAGTEMRHEEIVIVIIDSQIVKTFSRRPGKIQCGDRFEGLREQGYRREKGEEK
jgi:hypothetical protein